jgi:carboxyl-terminal processing protease
LAAIGNRARTFGCLLATFLILFSLNQGSDGDDARTRRRDIFVFDQTFRLVQTKFVDRRRSGRSWSLLKTKYRKQALAAKNQGELYDVILKMLGELKASHLTLVEDDVFQEHILAELRNELVLTYGLDLSLRKEGLFVSAVADGGAGHLAGMRRGDRILTIDDQDPRLSFALRPAGSDPGLAGAKGYHLSPKKGLKLVLERREIAKDNENIFTLFVKPSKWNLVQASFQSIRVEKRFTHSFGYIHMWHLGHSCVVDALHYAMRGPFRDCDGLILDLRGRGGTPALVDETLNLFKKNAPYGPRWTKPVVVIIDRGTRSAKEVLAFHLKQKKNARLVGETTQGAVLGAQFFDLRDGSHLMLPTVDMRALTFGLSLEGRGVKPHVEVKDNVLWANGHDPLMEKARDELFWLMRKKKRRRFGRGWY